MVDDVRADDGCRLWTVATGEGPPLIFCHGGPGLWDTFAELADGLPARTIRWDQRGCGRSERRGPYSVARSVADLDAVRQHHTGGSAALLGHSWGATLALRYALAHPGTVSRLGYVSGTGIDPDETWHATYKRNLGLRLGDVPEDNSRAGAVRQWSADFADPVTATGHAERMATPWYGINEECNATINAETREHPGLAARCRELNIPVLIVDGDADIRPRWAVDSLAEALPNVRRVTVADAGHLPWVERPDVVRQAITSFLEEGSAEGSAAG